MFEHKCYCRFCGLEASYFNKKIVLTIKEKKALEFTCNDCMTKIFKKRKSLQSFEQLALV